MFTRAGTLVALVAVLDVCSLRSAAQEAAPDAGVVAGRVGEYVDRYLSVVRRIVARESVTLQTLAENLSSIGPARRLDYETRVEWEPAEGGVEPKATVHRTLLGLDGRPAVDSDQTGCLQPASSEPLAFLLPAQRAGYSFSLLADRGARSGRALTLAFAPLAAGAPSLQWRGDCVSFDLPGMLRGQVAYDPATFAVLRLERHLIQPVRMPVARAQRRDDWGESITIEQLDVTITYKAVQFRQPDETLMLPVEIQRVTLARTPAVKAARVTQRFSHHTRFVTNSRVVPISLGRGDANQ